MAVALKITNDKFTAAELKMVSKALGDTAAMNARIAGESERWLKGPNAAGRVTAIRHRTATTLGAAPTGHLVKAYQSIEGRSDATSAQLLIPSGSLLASAFGPVTIRPKGGKRYLTLPAPPRRLRPPRPRVRPRRVVRRAGGAAENPHPLPLPRRGPAGGHVRLGPESHTARRPHSHPLPRAGRGGPRRARRLHRRRPASHPNRRA
jgi:hypothetical protein